MAVFFQFIAAFALFFGLGGLVYATEVSRRCQQLIDDRFKDIETKLAQRAQRQDKAIAVAARDNRNSIAALETIVLQQSREIVALSKALEPLQAEQENRAAQDKKIADLLRGRRAYGLSLYPVLIILTQPVQSARLIVASTMMPMIGSESAYPIKPALNPSII